MEKIMKIQLDRIDPNPAQPRRRFEDLEQLAKSIKADGLLEPIMVRPMGERFQIVHGERRWRACKMAGLAEIDATVREMDDIKAFELALVENIQRQLKGLDVVHLAFELALVENIQRQDLDPMEEAGAFTFSARQGNDPGRHRRAHPGAPRRAGSCCARRPTPDTGGGRFHHRL